MTLHRSWAVRVGGLAVVVGLLALGVASIFQVLSSIAAPLAFRSVYTQTAVIVGGKSLVIAAVFGLVCYSTVAAGSLLLLAFRRSGRPAFEKAGWAFVAVSMTFFITTDSFFIGLLRHVNELQRTATVFVDNTALFNRVIILGTIALGLGVPAILANEASSDQPILARPIL